MVCKNADPFVYLFMRLHWAKKATTSTYRFCLFLPFFQMEQFEAETEKFMKLHSENPKKNRGYSKFLLSVWNSYRYCKSKTGMTPAQLTDEYLRLKSIKTF